MLRVSLVAALVALISAFGAEPAIIDADAGLTNGGGFLPSVPGSRVIPGTPGGDAVPQLPDGVELPLKDISSQSGNQKWTDEQMCAEYGPRQAVLKARTLAVYALTKTPLATIITNRGEYLAEFLAPNLRGRVANLGTFNNMVLQQYFYSVAAVKPIHEVIPVGLTCNKNVCSGRVDLIGTKSSLTGDNPLLTGSIHITFIGNFYFNRKDQVVGMDIVLVNAGEAFDVAYGTDEMKALTINTNCRLIQEHCIDDYAAYESVEDCVEYTSSIPFGSYNRANSNSATCRNLHTNLLAQSPIDVGARVHCLHVTRADDPRNKICIDFPYESYYTDDIPNPDCEAPDPDVEPYSPPAHSE